LCSILGNKYQWFKGSIELRGEEADSLILDSISIDNSGIYFLQVKTCNEEFLEEFSDEEEIIFNYSFTLIVPLPKPDVDDPEPFCVGSREVLLTNKTGNIQGIITHWYNISDPDHLIYELPTYYYPVSKAFDTLLVRNALVAIPNFESDADTVVIISKPEIIQYGDSLTVEPTKEQLNARFSTATITYQWFRNEHEVTGMDQSSIYYYPSTNYQVRVVRNGCSATSDPVQGVTGIREDLLSDIKVYPNPSMDFLFLDFNQTGFLEIQILVSDVNGRVVVRDEIINLKKSPYRLSILNLRTGMYFLHIISGDQLETFRFIKTP